MNENKAIVPDEIISPDCNIDRIDRSHKNIKIETIIEYKNRGLGYSEIAKLTGCSRQNVEQRLKTVEYSKEDLENFKNHRKDVFAFLQSKLLNSIDAEEIKELNPLQRIIGAGILFDKEEKLQGTQERIDTFALNASIEELERRKQELLGSILEKK